MKKIGIITIHNCKSFGACLQTYALYQYFLNIGYDCEVIDLRRKEQPNFVKSRKYRPYYRDESYIVPIKRFIKKKIHLSPQVEDSSILNFEKFYSLIKLSSEYRSVDELYKNPPIYDIYVTGSDQVWNPYQPYCIEPYFLTFAPQGKKRISFAASIGVEYVENNILQDYKKWLSDYDFISVREKEAKMLLSTLTNKNIEVVSDPTFLLDISSWNSLCKNMNISTPYILLFSLSFQHELLDYVLKLHANSEFILVVLGANQPTIVQDNVIQFKDAGPIEFLSLIHGAKMVFTDSFHGTVFSLILGVDNFYTYIAKGNKRGSRILNLLERFGLNDHLLKTEVTGNLNEMFNLPINHQKVLGVISEIQKHDKDVLQYMLK